MRTDAEPTPGLTNEPLRLAVLQRVCPGYRLPLFRALTSALGHNFKLFVGDDLPHTKVRNAANLDGINYQKLTTRFIRLPGRLQPWHVGLSSALRDYDPDVVLSEGESHFLGYLQALYYRQRFKKSVRILHWCFITLPWQPNHRYDLAGRIKALTRKWFDGFVVYSSYSKRCLTELGVAQDKVFVATNVGDVARFLSLADGATGPREALKTKLGLASKFVVIYAGTLDRNKRPGVMLDLARVTDSSAYSYVILGDGPEHHKLKQRIESERLANVQLVGKVGAELADYYRAGDVLLVPGRGGIVMSEAMACGLPVIIHEGDGTEYDLVIPNATGHRVTNGNIESFRIALEHLRTHPDALERMRVNCQQLVRNSFSLENMVQQILLAARHKTTEVVD